jgi:glycosyltransferase involved in cell wall biosynthesis
MAMKRVLMVSPHFPPDSSAAAHRVRLLGPHLPDAGWQPTIVTLDPASYEGRLDPNLAALVPSTLDVVRAQAWRAEATRPFGLGDLGLRAFTGLGRVCRSLLSRGEFDLLFITLYPVYPALLGPRLKREFSIPFVLDYQDPWVGSWGLNVGGGPHGEADWKSRVSRLLGTWLEPTAVKSADALTAVSQGTIDGIVERIPAAGRIPHGVIPLGFESADFDALERRRIAFDLYDPDDGHIHLVYVGTLLPNGLQTLRLLLSGLALARQVDERARDIRLHLFGTSNQSKGDRHRALPLAAELGLSDVVTELPGRLDYLDALAALTHASGILLLGSSEPHYTASKLYPALLARRPVLAVFHEKSSVVSILQSVGREPTIRVVTYDDGGVLSADRIGAVARQLRSLTANVRYDANDVSLDRAEPVSASCLARQLAAVFNQVAA